MRTDLFDYFIPAGRIAQEPRPRGTSRLLLLDRASGRVAHRAFRDFPDLLRPEDLLVRNDVRVRRARLYGWDKEGRRVEIFLLSQREDDPRRWTALAKPGRRAKEGRTARFDEDLSAVVERVREDGKREVRFDRAIDDSLLERIGRIPLPPYIRRDPDAPDRPGDRVAYQTVFAREPLAVAAPTAGLHFTEEILRRIRKRGIGIADLTLAVGAGSFRPVTVERIEDHALEPEEASVPAPTLEAIEGARSRSGRIVAVGTTVARALEAAARLPPQEQTPDGLRFSAELFIHPGFEFCAVNALLTNFHLPRSSLLMLVCAFAGRERVLAAYEEAIREGYLFYSYGDAMLIT